ncbi:MAG: tripartite tricarboxylate transporter substrate binding protein [Burkholderiaceae bacterium]|nr:tripartite tricarboxylate transporter substrate binding protein [Burkholderiaceae bacterium]
MKIPLRLIGAMLSLCGAMLAQAQTGAYPNKPIRLVMPFAPGGTTDLVARIISEKMTTSLGQPVIVDSKPGASGMIGTDLVAKAAPDGYTIAIVISSHVLHEYLNKKVPFDALKDLQPVVLVSRMANVLVANPSFPVPANDVREFVAHAKAKGPLSFASAGNGQSAHLATMRFAQAAGIELNVVPYKGGGPAITDVVGGHVPITTAAVFTVSSHLRSGKVKPIFVTNARRLPLMPDTPTLVESGYPGLVGHEWWGILAPAGTPAAIVSRLNAEINRIFALPDVKERVARVEMEIIGGSAADFGKFMSDEHEVWGKVAKAAGIKPE